MLVWSPLQSVGWRRREEAPDRRLLLCNGGGLAAL